MMIFAELLVFVAEIMIKIISDDLGDASLPQDMTKLFQVASYLALNVLIINQSVCNLPKIQCQTSQMRPILRK